MAKRKKMQIITQEEIQRALNKFRASGGLITKLPDQIVLPRTNIGSKYGVYEPVTEVAE